MTQATIATLTINPSLDVSTSTEEIFPSHKMRCSSPQYDPGGGGVNVARVITQLGGQATAIYPAGGPTGAKFRRLLDDEGVHQQVVPVAGPTRENFAVYEHASGEQYRFVLPGPELSEDEQQQCLDAIAGITPKPDFIVASGSLAPGVPTGFYAQVAHRAREMGAKLVLDTSGEPLKRAGEEGAFLLKPSLRELSDLVGHDLRDEEDQIHFGRALLEQDHAEVMVLSLGADGAVLITRETSERFPALDVPIKSATGAGDSMVAGIVIALARGESLRNAVLFGMAAGSATLMTEGTELCHKRDVDRLYHSLTLKSG